MEFIRGIEVRAQDAPWRRAIEFIIFDRENRGVATQITFETYDEAVIDRPTFSMSRDHAQTLMDDLWNCGLRPTEGSGSAGSLKATENHLSDMQSIAFQLLEKLVGSS